MQTLLPRIGTLLGVWAHPDDEAYLSAGLMTVVRRSGGRVVVATATRGEHGTDDPQTWPPDRLAALREQELHRSLDVMDVREHVWLGHHDGELASLPADAGVAEVEQIIRRVRPDTIVTFGPEGMTGHEDHQTISSWTTEAWLRGGARESLWYATFTPAFHEEWGAVNEEVGLWFENAVPPVTPQSELAAQVVCTGELAATKHRVLRAHASQTTQLEAAVGPEVYRQWWSVESFVAAAPDRARTLTAV